MPQVCITKVERIFQSNNPLQETMKETWKILQSGMCVSKKIYIAMYYMIYNHLSSFVLKTDQMLRKLLTRFQAV